MKKQIKLKFYRVKFGNLNRKDKNMKKKYMIFLVILTIISIILILGCTTEASASPPRGFNIVTQDSLGNTNYVLTLVHKESQIMYIMFYTSSAQGGNIQIMLDEDGLPLKYK